VTNNFRCLLFVSLFLCLANVLFSQEEGTGGKHRISWTKDDYALRYEVVIQREENKKYSPALQEFTEDAFIIVSLPPGNYRLRVIPYDFRDVPGRGTGWKNFKVLAVTTPSGSGAEPESRLVMEDPSSVSVQDDVNTPQQAEDKTPEENKTENASSSKIANQEDKYIGPFAELVGYSRYSIATGGGIIFGKNFNGMGIGLRLLYAQDPEEFGFLEALAHLRFYLSSERWDNAGIFLQFEGGAVLFFFGGADYYYSGGEKHHYDLPDTNLSYSFAGGLCVGWRLMVTSWWYVEPYIRVGYPYIIGAGLTTGIRYDLY